MSTESVTNLPREPVFIGSNAVDSANVLCSRLRHFIEAEVTMSIHVSKTVASCFATLQQLRRIQRSVSRSVLLSLITSLVLSCLDYGNEVKLLQPFPNACRIVSSRFSMQQHALICHTLKYNHVSPLLRELHLIACSSTHQIQIQTSRTCVSLSAQLGT